MWRLSWVVESFLKAYRIALLLGTMALDPLNRVASLRLPCVRLSSLCRRFPCEVAVRNLPPDARLSLPRSLRGPALAMLSSAFDLVVPAGPLRRVVEQTERMSMGEIRAARFAHYSREVADALFEPGVDCRDSVRRMLR